jgi:hypothetical protein
MIILFLGHTPRSAKSRLVLPSVRTISGSKDSQGRYLCSSTYAAAVDGMGQTREQKLVRSRGMDSIRP